MNNQLTISFNSVHRFENNPASQAILEARNEDFNEDNWEVLKLLLKSQRLRVIECAVARITGHLPRRICDLREYGIAIEMDMVTPNGGGRKIGEYYMKPEEINRVLMSLVEGIRFQRIKKAA